MRWSSKLPSAAAIGKRRTRGGTCRGRRPKRKFEVVHRPTATQQYVLQLADAPASEDDDRYAAKLLATIVGDDSGSRMYWELTDPASPRPRRSGITSIWARACFTPGSPASRTMVEENLNRLRGIYRQVELDGVTEDELQQAKNKVKARVVLGSERPQSRLFNVGGNWLQRREYRTVADDIKSLDDVTVDGGSRCAQEVSVFDRVDDYGGAAGRRAPAKLSSTLRRRLTWRRSRGTST